MLSMSISFVFIFFNAKFYEKIIVLIGHFIRSNLLTFQTPPSRCHHWVKVSGVH